MNKSTNCYRSVSRLVLLAINTACLAIVAAPVTGRTTYVVTDLGVLPGKQSSVAAAINSHGQVTGTSSLGSLFGDAAFRYDNKPGASLQNLNQDNSDASRGFGINDFGVVAGDSTHSNTRDGIVRRAAVFSNGTVIDLGILRGAGSYSRANSVNNAAYVVGFAARALDSPKSRAFVWSKSAGMQDIGTLGGEYAQALAINNLGAITGNAELEDEDQGEAIHAFFYQLLSNPRVRNVMRDLGTLGGSYSSGTSVSPRNHVVGYSTLNNVDDRVHAFLHDGFVMRDLGSIVGQTPGIASIMNDKSVALGVNINDVVVGYSFLASAQRNTQGQQVAFVYNQGLMTDLNTLLLPAGQRRYLLYSANAINDKGQIAATALVRAVGQFHAVLLTPTNAR